MIPTPTVNQVRIAFNDQHVKCGNAVFTPGSRQLRVTFLDRGDSRTVVAYDLTTIPMNQACLLHDADGRPTLYLVCNQWGTIYVRYGEVTDGTRYPALHTRRRTNPAMTEVRLVDDLLNAPHAPRSALHPTLPLGVALGGDSVRVDIYQGGITEYQFEVKLKKLPLGQWHTPTDNHRRPLPVRLRRPILAGLFKAKVVDVRWIG